MLAVNRPAEIKAEPVENVRARMGSDAACDGGRPALGMGSDVRC